MARLVVAVDVGLCNLALCALRVPAALTESEWPPRLTDAARVLRGAALDRWVVEALGVTRKDAFARRSEAVSAFVRAHSDLLQRADVLVVEHQMQSDMRCVAAALFACVRMINDAAQLVFQHSRSKLAWVDLASAYESEVKSYAARKRAAVACARFVATAQLREVLERSSKKDDMADALLHLLSFELRERRPKRAKRSSTPGARASA
jgi:hypothetical protein